MRTVHADGLLEMSRANPDPTKGTSRTRTGQQGCETSLRWRRFPAQLGIVFKAHDTKLSRVVAVKVLLPSPAANAAARKRFLREARAAAAVSHDHVVTVCLWQRPETVWSKEVSDDLQ